MAMDCAIRTEASVRARLSQCSRKVGGQKSEVRGQLTGNAGGAVRTSVTLLGQDMGNSYCLLFFGLICSFVRADIRPNKIARRQIYLAQEQAPKPHFEQILCDGVESN